jgi:pimeloyl-ACP methyl ester carboxylesterase
MIDVGGYKLHLYCLGKGSPTVILEPGFAKFSLNVRALQERIAGFTHVCAYDHAGIGWSEAGLMPRTGAQLVKELSLLLKNAQIDGPYILLAHSFGGLSARLFAVQHQVQMAGLILVDATPPDFLHTIARMEKTDGLKMILRSTLATARTGRWSFQTITPVFTLLDDVPETLRPVYLSLVTMPSHIETALSEWESRLTTADQVLSHNSLGRIPLVVLIAGDRLKRLNNEDRLWLPAQVKQAELSLNRRVMIPVTSGHNILLDDPEAVVDALHWIIDQR